MVAAETYLLWFIVSMGANWHGYERHYDSLEQCEHTRYMITRGFEHSKTADLVKMSDCIYHPDHG